MPRCRLLAVAVALTAALAGCSQSGEPADVDAGGIDAAYLARPAAPINVAVPTRAALDGNVQQPPDVGPPGAFAPRSTRLTPLTSTGLEAVVAHPGPLDDLGYGPVAALVDLDRDGALDVFLAGDPAADEAACVYRNISTPGAVRFERVQAWCLSSGLRVEVALADPVNDGTLLAIVADTLWRVGVDGAREAPEWRVAGTAEPQCAASAVLAVDIDMNGVLDLLASCHIRGLSSDPGAVRPLRAWTNEGDVVWEGAAPLFGAAGNALALGATDVNRDGLYDVLAVVDTFSGPLVQNAAADPGGARLRVAPSGTERWREVRFGSGPDAWGSFMGVAEVHTPRGPTFTLTDFGRQRLVAFEQDGFNPRAMPWPFTQSMVPTEWLYSWSAVTEDLDGNGSDDILVTQGLLPSGEVHWAAHANLALVQNGRGGFVALSEAAGLRPSFPPAEGVGTPARSSRGILRADFDGDGALEFVLLSYDGPPEVYRLETGGERCTVFAEPSVVPSLGWGVGYGPTATGPWAMRHIQGQLRVSDTNAVYPPAPSGFLRFASGAVVPYDCSATRRVSMEEPDWIGIRAGQGDEPGRAVAWVDPAYAPGSITAWAERDQTGLETVFVPSSADRPTEVEIGPTAVAIMVQVNGQWVGRWWETGR